MVTSRSNSWSAPRFAFSADRIQVPPSSSAHAFELGVAVLPADIDELGHVNNTVYLRWVQDVATEHWRATADSAAQETIAWVVVRHEIDYKAPAVSGDDVLLRTWLGHGSRATFERFTEIQRTKDRLLLARARTLWCPINATTRRPIRVPAEVRAQFSGGETSDAADGG